MTETPVRDSFDVEALAFVAAWDKLNLVGRKSFGDIPDAEIVRPVIRQAEFIYCQRNNPFRDFTGPQLLVVDLAAEFLRWLPDFTNPDRWSNQFGVRWDLHHNGYPWGFDPDE
jgi:hypothetical protein